MSSAAMETPYARGLDMKLEVVVIPVSDVDRAKRLAGFLGQCAAQALRARRILEHEHLLQKDR